MGQVAVCGAGPGGAALAYLLARRGLEVTLIERQTDFAREFRGEALMPSGRDAFRQMGLEADFDQLAHTSPDRVRLHRNGRFLFEISAEGRELDDASLPRIVSQPELLEMLVARSSKFPGFRFLRGVDVSDLVQEGGRATGVQLRGEGAELIPADFVIGADGRGSLVRRRAGLTDDHDAERFDIVWFKVPRPDFLEHSASTALVYLKRGHLMLCFPTYDGSLQVAWIIDKGSYGDLRREGLDHWLEEMARHAGSEMGRHLRASKGELKHPFVLDVVCYLLPRWTSPGLMLLGDAAHPMSPVGGQGINIALRDALVAANHLVPALESGADPDVLDAAAQAFQKERYPEVELLQRMQRIPPRLIFERSWWNRWVLAVLPTLARLQLLFPRGGPAIERFMFGVTDVELRV
jgi:2-polyprenyl-6-methoxyphenol hydroxylase-like FAD-dependent oxidoreductase